MLQFKEILKFLIATYSNYLISFHLLEAKFFLLKCSFILRTLTRDDVTKLPKMSRQETSSQSFQEKVTKIILEREEVFTSVLVGKHFWLA